jgi:hypothetical protein
MSIDKKESLREGSEDSMEINSPTPEAETGAPQENVSQQKRKGGRKPVCTAAIPRQRQVLLICIRYMLLPRNVSSATARLKLRSESVAQSISSNWKKLSEFMKPICIICRLPIEVPPMSVLC